MHRQLRSCAAMEVDQSPLAMDLRAFSSTCQAVLGAATAMAMEDDDDDTAAVRAMEDEMHEEETYARKGKGAPGVSHPIAQTHVLLARRVTQKNLAALILLVAPCCAVGKGEVAQRRLGLVHWPGID